MLDYTMALMADEGAGYVLSTSKSLNTKLLCTQVRLAKKRFLNEFNLLINDKQGVLFWCRFF